MREPIFIGAACGIKSRMRFVFYAANPMHRNILRQQSVELKAELTRIGYRFGGIEMRDHHAGVDACIGAPGCGQRSGVAEQKTQRLLHYFLYAYCIRLILPTVITVTIIFKFCEITHVDFLFIGWCYR